MFCLTFIHLTSDHESIALRITGALRPNGYLNSVSFSNKFLVKYNLDFEIEHFY